MPYRQMSLAIAIATLSAHCVAAVAADLRPFTPMEAYCTFSTVDGRRPVSTDYRRGEGVDEGKGKLYCFDQPHCRCQVRYVDLPEAKRGLSRRDLVSQYGFPLWSKGEDLKSLGPVKSGEKEGEDFAIVGLRNTSGEPIWIRVRVFVVGKRAFFVSASFHGDKETVAEPEAMAFLASFVAE